MKPQNKVKRDLEKIQALFAKYDVEAPKIDIDKETTAILTETAFVPVNYEAEAVLILLHKPERFIRRQCKRCSESFLTDYHAVSFCSDNCRMLTLRKQGLNWDPNKSQQERWGGQPPLVISSDIVEKLTVLLCQTHEFPDPYFEEPLPIKPKWTVPKFGK